MAGNSEKDYLAQQDNAFQAAKNEYIALSCMISGVSLPMELLALREVVRVMYETLDNAHYSFKKGFRCFSVHGEVFSDAPAPGEKPVCYFENYFYKERQEAELKKLVDALTMATYQCHGGNKYTYAPFLVASIENVIEAEILERGA